MFWNRSRKSKRGFILIYVLFIGLICIFISMGCYSMETLIKSDDLHDYKMSFKTDNIEKYREILITRLNEYINKSVGYHNDNDISKYFSNLKDFRICYQNSYVYYDKNSNTFKLEYIIDNKFCREETYEYTVNNGRIKYGCINYSI